MNMDDKELMWEELSRESIIQNEWIDFRRSAWLLAKERGVK